MRLVEAHSYYYQTKLARGGEGNDFFNIILG